MEILTNPRPTVAKDSGYPRCCLRLSSSACAFSARRRVRSAFRTISLRASRSAFVSFFFAIVVSQEPLDSIERPRNVAHVEE